MRGGGARGSDLASYDRAVENARDGDVIEYEFDSNSYLSYSNF